MLTKKRENRPTSEASAVTRDSIFRLLGVRLTPADLGNLDPAEHVELVSLTRKIENPTGTNVNNLSAAERKKWESLVEGAAQLAPGFFADKRRQDDTERTLEALARKARMPVRERWQPPAGAVVLLGPDLVAHLDRDAPGLTIAQLGVLTFVMACLENGMALSPNSRFEGDGDDLALVLDRGFGLGAKYGDAARMERDLDHLARNDWVRVEKHGQEIHVRRGGRYAKGVSK